MIDTQYGIAIMGGREVSRPYRVCFSSKASGFYPFDDATALAGEGGVGDVVCLIQASASNHKPKKSQTKGTVLLVCGLCGLLEIRHATSPTTGAKHWHR
ncbi:MAG: hypothetical protein SPF86_04370 [Sodaliphilus sp.]|jgi:hypothetical protein|nr:hypothetical protein [Bacteroidales bacterium]MDY5538488.1 hypothetical protein [Sodaliphilus sp.]